MALVNAPLLSFNARGQIAKSIVYSEWKGVKYARQYAVPANPKTVAQEAVRDLFSWLHDQFKFMPTAVAAVWNLYAKGKPMTGGNAFIQANLALLLGAANSDAIVITKPVAGGPPAATIAGTPAALSIAVVATAGSLPAGWTLVSGTLVCMKEVTVFAEQEQALTLAETVASPGPYSYTFTGLISGQVYIIAAFFEYTRPDGSTAYGGQVSTVATAT